MASNDPPPAGRLPRELAHKVDSLVQMFNGVPVMDVTELRRRHRAHMRKTVPKMIEDGITYGEASGGPRFLQQDEASFRQFLRTVDQDLNWQCDTVADAFKRFREIGEVPAPYYPMRIAILLRKAKEHDREKFFLRAWCRHFPSGNGVKYAKLVQRAMKLGAIDALPVSQS